MKPQIHFFHEGVVFKIKEKPLIRTWIETIIRNENKRTGEIAFIFCSNEYLLQLNQTFLQKNTLTDIITFPSDDSEDIVAGDIFISIPMVESNALKYKQPFRIELFRVMAHGILHLIGYKDKTKPEKKMMTKMEDTCISLIM